MLHESKYEYFQLKKRFSKYYHLLRIVRKTTDTNNATNLECGYELCPFHQEKTVW
jgi:hypothetical protein